MLRTGYSLTHLDVAGSNEAGECLVRRLNSIKAPRPGAIPIL